ncbi:MAG TPA: ATP-grasp domain-containing protein [Candidatus Polarisedimenticolaceae bacterium]|nr:ATP-grasp domain-containing protein [Candidatus Polarisedimenticolaceae bacterium]
MLVLMHESLVPPESIEGLSDKELAPFKTEFDVTSTLREMGHEVLPLGVDTDLGVLRQAMEQFNPQITFNLLEEFHGVAIYDQHVVSYLELMKRHYTGCNPRGLMLAHDKALSKQVMAFHRISVPDFAVYPMNRSFREPPKRLAFPLLVKSLTAEGSVGIAQASLVHDAKQLRERTEFVHRQTGTDAIAERYIDGRELYVGVWGNRRLDTLPVWELRYADPRRAAPLIATAKIKWDWAYQQRSGIVYGPADDLDEALGERIRRTCKRAYRVLNLTGYARIDLRVTDDGRIYVLEANPNPDLSYGGEFAESAETAGIAYDDILDRIIQLGLSYRAQWQSR